MPWAALYCLALDSSQPEALHICPIWLDHLAQATVDDEPLACGHREDCPLQGENSRLTVCPWGFWGMLHQIEQPLQHIRPQPLGQTPDELASPSWGLESRLISDPRQKVRILGAVNASLPELPSHRRALQELAASGDVVFVWEETARDVVRQLHRGGFHLDYFYCHGETVDTVFRLKLGTDAQPSLLAADLLDPTDISWRDPPQPLILLNGCATMSQDPSIINDFMQTLRKLGALGVVGTEIPIADPLARFMALRLIDDLLNGRSLGEALLHARQRLAQELNPLGLIYTIYGPTTLHLHRTDHCEWCDAHRF